MKVSPDALRWLLVRPLDLGRSRGRRSELLVQRLQILDDERKVAGKRNYFTAVVVVVM